MEIGTIIILGCELMRILIWIGAVAIFFIVLMLVIDINIEVRKDMYDNSKPKRWEKVVKSWWFSLTITIILVLIIIMNL